MVLIPIAIIQITQFKFIGLVIAVITIKNLSEETLRAIKQRAKKHEHSTEAEICLILDAAVLPKNRIKIGSALAEFGKQHGGIDLNLTRDNTSLLKTDVPIINP